jgi:hypothetical protein
MKLDLSHLDEAGSEFDVIATRMRTLTINGYAGSAEFEIDDQRNATLTFKTRAKSKGK